MVWGTSVKRIISLLKQARSRGQKTGQGSVSILVDAAWRRFGATRIGLSEYFEYAVYSQRDLPRRDDYIGFYFSECLDRELNADFSRELANDKLINYIVLDNLGIAIPKIVACYSACGRRIRDAKS